MMNIHLEMFLSTALGKVLTTVELQIDVKIYILTTSRGYELGLCCFSHLIQMVNMNVEA